MRWIWIDRILELEKGSRCVAVKNVSLAEEHLHDHFPAADDRRALPIMPASLIIEGMAQTAGILVGHARDFAEKVILAKIGRVELERDVTPGQTLIYTATLERIDESGASTFGQVEMIDHADAARQGPARTESGSGESGEQRSARLVTIGRIELTFSHIDRNRQGLAFPERNFVFTDQFMDLMRNSGVA